MATEKRRRQHGTGSVHQRATDGRWIGTVEAGWTAKGTRRRITVSAATEAEAKRRLRDKQRQIAADGIPAAEISSRATVRTWSKTWLAELQHSARPRYYATDASIVARWIVPTIGHRPLAALTPADVRALVTAIRDAGRSTTTAAYAHGTLERMLKAAIVEGHAVQSRVLMVPPPGKAVSDRDAIPLDHAAAMLQVAATLPDGSRWVAAFLQGMRQGECLGLTWDALDLDTGELDISWQLQALPYEDRAAGTFRTPDGYEVRPITGAWHLVRPKTGAGVRVIPLVPWMTASLRGWQAAATPNPWGLVWPAERPVRGGKKRVLPQTGPGDRAAWYALQDAAGVRHATGRYYLLHEARHATATLLMEGGVSEAVIIAIMGHSAIATTRRYQHVSQALARRALDDVAERLGLTNGPDHHGPVS